MSVNEEVVGKVTRAPARTMNKDTETQVLLTVVVPVYNECDTILRVVNRVLHLDLDLEVIVVDDGSTDGTREQLATLDDERVRVYLHEKNKGKGAAVRTGFSHALGDIVTIQDADLELNPVETPNLVAPVASGEADVVFGSRFANGWKHRSLINGWANWFLSTLTNILFGTKVGFVA